MTTIETELEMREAQIKRLERSLAALAKAAGDLVCPFNIWIKEGRDCPKSCKCLSSLSWKWDDEDLSKRRAECWLNFAHERGEE